VPQTFGRDALDLREVGEVVKDHVFTGGFIFRCGRAASQSSTSLSIQAIRVPRPPGPISRATGNLPARIQEKMLP
jgi:hypothetical protein